MKKGTSCEKCAGQRDPKTYRCPACRRAYLANYQREWQKRPENAERVKRYKDKQHEWRAAYMREWEKRPGNREKRLQRSRALPETEKRNYHLMRMYGIGVEEYERLLAKQEGVCAICLNPPTGRRRYLSVDHDHQTGEVRGLLCNNCNAAVGFMAENVDAVIRLRVYLEQKTGSLTEKESE